MEKGKFGISLTTIAVIAFIFGILREPLAILLVVGFALLAERDEWLNKQVVQALLLTITYYLAALLSNSVFGGISRMFGFLGLNQASSIMARVSGFIGGIIYIVLVVFSLMAISKVFKGRDANLPYLSKLIGGGLAPASPASYAAQAEVTANPVSYAPQATAQAEVASVAEKVDNLCPSCSAPLDPGSRFCAECGSQV